MNSIRAIVFDVDGTLYPQRALRLRMLPELAACFAAGPTAGLRTFKILRAYQRAHELARASQGESGSVRELQFRIASEISGEPLDAVTQVAREWFEQRPLKHLRKCLYDGAGELLRRARHEGIRLGVLSDYPAAEKIEAMGLFEYFDAVVSSQDPDVGLLKPQPLGLLACIERLGVDPSDALYVGDRADVDLPCAARAGTQFVLFGKAPARPGGLAVSNYRQLGRLLGFNHGAQAGEREFVGSM